MWKTARKWLESHPRALKGLPEVKEEGLDEGLCMSKSYIRNVIEAALLAAGRPVQLAELGLLFEEGQRPEGAVIREALAALQAEYSARGIEIKETAGGFRIQVRASLATEVSRLWPERPARYSRALLETLALIAYRQPITRAEIEAVRGVAVNPNILKTVIERNWVRVVGTREVPGRPELLGTTREFLDYFGLKSLDELPPLAELKVLADVPVQLELGQTAEAGAPPAGAEHPASNPVGSASTAAGAEKPSPEDALALAEAVVAEVEAARAAGIQSQQAPPAADPPSPFVEPVIDQRPAAPESTESEPPPAHDSASRLTGGASRRRKHAPQDADSMLEDDAADQEKPSVDGKAGMAAGPQDMDR
jgi:segregation and condensation protein B